MGKWVRRRSFSRDLKAVSPVIATIIIVSIAIVMSIAVAYWMLGIGSAFTRYEKLEFVSAYASAKGDGTGWDIKIKVKNTGSAPATIEIVFFNGKPHSDLNISLPADLTKALEPGYDTGTVTISVLKNGFKSGMSLEILLQTVAGRQYPKTIILP